MKIITKTACALVMLTGTAAFAQDSTMETDADGNINMDQFSTGFSQTGNFTSCDSDGDSMLSEDEYNSCVFRGYDRNQDEKIDADERTTMDEDMGSSAST
ncbi:hypothetical protein [Roseovarius sp. M141]|uniref:hypothetical protein n=1 Tax=Roseovarius sp. M141 TaxID=2583806 RepID=UPI0020CBB4C5|nr:hypothetical protein [Roseovarius sp. M141]MCQ0090872.1 hypothetical protein [Roseovarius sp. M141]